MEIVEKPLAHDIYDQMEKFKMKQKLICTMEAFENDRLKNGLLYFREVLPLQVLPIWTWRQPFHPIPALSFVILLRLGETQAVCKCFKDVYTLQLFSK